VAATYGLRYVAVAIQGGIFGSCLY
jgi:hypothetical protein